MPADRQVATSVVKAFTVVQALAEARGELTLSELARRTALPLPTAHRILATFEYAGWVVRAGRGGGFRLSLRLAEIGAHVLATSDLRTTAQPIMQELTHRTGAVSYLLVRDGDHCVCIERIESTSMVRAMTLDVGHVLPWWSGAASLAMLAYADDPDRLLASAQPAEHPAAAPQWPPRAPLDDIHAHLARIRAAGYSVSSDELVLGITALGVPVFSADGAVAASISIGGLSETMLGPEHDRLVADLQAAGAELSRLRGARQSGMSGG